MITAVLSSKLATSLIGLGGAAIIYRLVWPIFIKKIRVGVKKKVSQLPKKIEVLIKEPELREFIIGQFFLAQKFAKGKTGIEKMQWVRGQIRKKFPDFIEQYIIDIADIVYNELISVEFINEELKK
jgi:hypothetical protein